MNNSSGTATKAKLWTFVFVRIGIVTALSGVCRQMFMSAFPQYLQMQGFTPTQMGLVASGYTVFAMMTRVLSGNLIDTRGRRVMLMIGLILFGTPIVGFMVSGSIAVIVACRFLQGMGASLASISTGTMAPDVLPKERMAEGIGYYGLFNSMATAVGPAVGIGFLIDGRPDIFFLFGLSMIVIAFPISATLNYEKKEKAMGIVHTRETQPTDPNTGFIWRFLDKKALPAAAIMALISFSTTAITNFLSPYAVTIGLTDIGAFFTVQALFMIVARVSSNRISQRIGIFRTIVLGFVLDIIALVLLGSMTNDIMMFTAAAIRGLGGGICMPLLNVLAVRRASRSERGKATSTYYAAFDVGSGLGAAFWGFTADYLGGYRTVYYGSALFYIITFMASLKLIGKSEGEDKK